MDAQRSMPNAEPTPGAGAMYASRIIDGIAVYLVATISIMVTQRRQRLGDLAAETVAVRHPAPGRQRVLALAIALAVLVAGVVAGTGLG